MQNLLQSFEKQRWVIAATVLAGAVDIAVAWILIPAHGAVGACIANGVAQFLAVALLWGIAIGMFKIKLPWLLTAKVAFVSVAAASIRPLSAPSCSPGADSVAVLVCGSVSIAVLLLLFYLFRILQEEDRERLNQVASMLPGPLPAVARTIVSVLIRTRRVPLTAKDAALF